MIEELRAKLSDISARLARGKKIDSMLRAMQNEERELARHERDLKAVLSREEDDVSRLERTTATSLLYSLLGKKVERLDKEQQEAYAAKLKYDAAVRQLDDCRARMAELRKERDSLACCSGQYEQIFAELKGQLREDPSYAEKFCDLERRSGETAGQLRELDEAVSAGNAALEQIERIENCLGSAGRWGTWDLIGGGLISDMAKHSKLDEAQAGAEHLQVLLSRFHAELADVRLDAQMGALNIGGFLRFADYFFDGLIADWSVLSRIRESQESVCRMKRQVNDVLARLRAVKAARAAEKADMEKQISELVTGA
jgi:hypothetical protein